MKEYLRPELLIDLFLQADVMTESANPGLDNDYANPWTLEMPEVGNV